MTHVRLLSQFDAAAYYQMIDRSREALFMFSWAKDFSLERAEKMLAKVSEHKMHVYGVFLDSLLVGCIEVRDHDLKIHGHELGYFMDAQNRGRGRMKEALPLVMNQHQDIFPFYADVPDDNSASLWLLWGLGFKEDHRWKKDEASQVLVRLVYNKHLK